MVTGTATVTINDANGTAIDATELSAIGGETIGTVTVTNAIAITGTEDELVAALVADSTKVVANTATVSFTVSNSVSNLHPISIRLMKQQQV